MKTTQDLKSILQRNCYPENFIDLIESFADPNSYDLNIEDFKFIEGCLFNKFVSVPNAWVSPNGYIMFTNSCKETTFLYQTGADTNSSTQHIFKMCNISIYRISESRAEYILSYLDKD